MLLAPCTPLASDQCYRLSMAFYHINRMYRFELLVEIKARVIFMSHVEIVEINTTGV